MADAGYGEIQKYGKIEAPDMPTLPEPHPEKRRRAEGGHEGYKADLEAIERLTALMDEPDFREAWTANFYIPGRTTTPADLAESIHALTPGFKSPYFNWNRFGDKVRAVARDIEKYLATYRHYEEQVVGQEAIEKIIALEDRVKRLEEKAGLDPAP